MKLFHLAAAVVLLSAMEVVLIVLGVLPPVLAYSPGNILFSLATLAIIAYAGIVSAPEGLKKSALNGALLASAGAATLCVLSLLGSALLGKSILGLPYVSSIASLAILLASILITNAVLGTIVAAIAGFIAVRASLRQQA